MPAASTDLLKKLSRRWVGQIGSGGVADASTATVPLSSTTNLPTDTAVVATIDRVDANGVATPSLEETVVGVVSGSNLATCTRGVEGTAQAHSAGAVVEILVTAKGYNDIIDALLVEHDQDGTHDATLIAKLAGSQTFTGLKTFGSALLKATRAMFVTSIDDTNGNEVIEITATASAVNQAKITNSATGNAVEIAASGGDSNIDLDLKGKGTGGVKTRLKARITTIVSSATPTVNTDNTDFVTITALAAAITSMTTNLSGTPANGDKLLYRIKDDGTARAIAWGASFANRGATLPTTTTLGKVTYVGLIWNSVASTWDCVAAITEA